MMENSKIKICHVASSDQAIKFLLFNQLQFLKEQGYEVSAVCSDGIWSEGIRRSGLRLKNITITRKIFSPFSDLAAFFKLFFYFRKEKFQIVHTHSPKAALLGQMAAKLAGVPITVNTWHGFFFNEQSSFLRKEAFVLVERIAAIFSDLIFSQNPADIEVAKKENIAKADKMRPLGNGIDLQRFNPDRFSKEFKTEKRKKLDLPENYKIIGIVGRLVREKGYLEIFEALSRVVRQFPNVLLLAISPLDPQKEDPLNPKIIEKYGIEKNVKFLALEGERTDIDEIYPLMDIFVLPSWREGFPRSILEASAMGVPVITSDIKGCRQAINPNQTGILFPVKDVEKLSEAVIYLLNRPEEAKEMGRKGREMAEKEFDEKQIFSIIKNTYQTLLETKMK